MKRARVESDNLLFCGRVQASLICNHTISLFFFAGLHSLMVHFTMAIRGGMNGFRAARLCTSIRKITFETSPSEAAAWGVRSVHT